MWSIQGCWGRWQKSSLSHLQSFTGRSGEVLSDWELAVVTPICKKGQKEGLGSYRPVCLILVLDNVMPQVITSVIIWHMQDNQRDQVQPV